jgi:hypothetical protein
VLGQEVRLPGAVRQNRRLDRSEQQVGLARPVGAALEPLDADGALRRQRLDLVGAGDSAKTSAVRSGPNDSTIDAVAAQPDSSHAKRCQAAESTGTTLPRGPMATTGDPGCAVRAQRAPGPFPWATTSRSMVDDSGSKRRIVERRLIVWSSPAGTASMRS